MDIFSTALASANINLDTFQYMDEGLGMYRLSSVIILSYCTDYIAL